MSENDKHETAGGSSKKLSRSDEVKAALQELDRKHRAGADAATQAAEKERRTLMASVLERVAEFGRQHTSALAQLRDWREKQRQNANKKHEEALRQAKGNHVRALNEIEQKFTAQRDEANQVNTMNVAPVEAEMRTEDARLAEQLSAQLRALRETCDDARSPLVAEQQALEQQAKARAEQMKAKAEQQAKTTQTSSATG